MPRPGPTRRFALACSLAAAALAAGPAAAAPEAASTAGALTLAGAIRAAWSTHPALRAGDAQAESLREEARAADDARTPTLSFGARALRTTEPVAAFGLKLDQGRIGSADFNPDSLNNPDPIYSWGFSASITQPLYAGGRIEAGRRASSRMAEAAGLDQQRRRQELALGVAQAYFGSQTAEHGVRFAEDLLGQARETEAFVRLRAAAGAMLDADAARATAFRAQAEAEVAGARQRLASVRSTLALLCGEGPAALELVTPLEGGTDAQVAAVPAVDPARFRGRADLAAARARASAAEDGAAAARSSLLPEVFLQLAAETARRKPDEGAIWTTALIGARWQLSLGALDGTRAAQARARAAAEAAAWQERQADREVGEALRALAAAAARAAAAQEAVAAGEAVRSQRTARHRQGLLPLSEVLDAETGLSGARTLLLHSRFESRLAGAQLQLALGQPVEGVAP